MALSGIAIGVIKRSIRRAYTHDISGARTLGHLRDLGYRINTARFYDLRREIIASTPLAFEKLFYRPTKPLSHSRHIRTEDRFPTTYKYVVEVRAGSILSGEEYTFTTGVYSDNKLSGEEIRSMIQSRFSEGASRGSEEVMERHALEFRGTFLGIGVTQAFRH